MGGGHHVQVPKVPDWRSYRVEDAPELVQLQNALAKHGLKDPWLRNDVWRYTQGLSGHKIGAKLLYFATRGIKPGVLLGILTAGLEFTLFPVHHKYDEIHEGPHH